MVNSNSKKYLDGLEGLEGVKSLDGLNHSVSSRVLDGLNHSVSSRVLEGFKTSVGSRELAKAMSQTELSLREGLKPSIIETFDGVRKSNARKIFGILLIIIIIDFAMDIVL